MRMPRALKPNTDYVPAIAGANYLRVENTGISSSGNLNLVSPNGLNSFQLNDISWAVILGDGTDFVQFDASSGGGFGATASQSILFSAQVNYYAIAGASCMVCDALTGFSASDETGNNTIALTAAGMDVTAPYQRCAGVVGTGVYTVATLPTGTIGDRAFVSDALAPTFLTAVVGGGAVKVPVFHNGTTWIVG